MKVMSRQQMQALDAETIDHYSIPGILLMEHAAYQVFEVVQRVQDEKVTIVCGSGNNGGDGFALARQLVTWTTQQVQVICMTPTSQLTGEAAHYYRMCAALDVPCIDYKTQSEQAIARIADSTCIVDALLGTGLTRSVRGVYEEVIQHINANHQARVISIDIPSGIDCDRGVVLGSAVKADVTVTFEYLKVGLCIYPGIAYAGEVLVREIGIPQALKEGTVSRVETIDAIKFQELLPTRPMRSHKGTFGKLLLIGGSKSMAGAITLATQAALKVGVGTVTVGVPESIYPVVEQSVWEAMTVGCSTREGQFSVEAVEQLLPYFERSDVIGIGPGIGRGIGATQLVAHVLATPKPCIIDADALFVLKSLLPQLQARTQGVVLTPHPSEFAHLIDKSVEEVLEAPLIYAKAFVEKYPVTLVLKLERTLVVTSDTLYINTTGNTGLAKGGSGDVLTGIIAGYLATTQDALRASVLGVYTHGKAADIVVTYKSPYAMCPSDLYEGIEKLFI